MALYEELEIDQGSTFKYNISLKQESGVPYDLTGYAINAQAKKNYRSALPSIIFTTASTNPGVITISLTDEETVVIPHGRYVFDVVVESPAGEKFRVMEGMITVTAGVTSGATTTTDELILSQLQQTLSLVSNDLSISDGNTVSFTTDNVGEGSNLYYTDARVQTKLGNVSGDIIPDTDVAYNIGSATNRFNDLYLSGTTINLGNATISSPDGTSLLLNGGDLALKTYVDTSIGGLTIPTDINELTDNSNLLSGGVGTLQAVTDLGATSTNKLTLADGITLDATNVSYTVQPIIHKIDYFNRNMDINTPADGAIYNAAAPWIQDPATIDTAGMTLDTLPWGYQSLTGEPLFAHQQIMGIISDQGAVNGKFIIGNVSMVGGIGEPVWTIGYVDEGDDHGGAQNMYKKGDGTNTNGLLTSDFKPILSLEPSGTIAAVRGKNTTALADPDKVSHNAGSFFEGFYNGDLKPAFRIQGLNDPLSPGDGGALIEFGPAGNRETDFQLSRWTKDQVNIRENNQNFMNWVNNPTWRRGLVMENGTATYWIGEGSKIEEVFSAGAGQQTFTIAQDLTGDYSVKDVVINGMFLRDNIWSMSGQDITIPTAEESIGYGVTIELNDEVRIIITDSNKNQEISAKNLWNAGDSRNELTIAGGIIRVSDLVNNSGVSAFAGGGMQVTTLNDADDANVSEPSVGWNLGTLNWPAGVQYGQTLTVTGDGDTAFQVTSGFGNDTVYFRSGNPENVSGSWNGWYQVASREWVNAQGFGGPNILIQDLNDADVVDFTKPSVSFNLGTTNFPAGTQYGQTLTVTGNGDTQWQMTSGFNNDQIYFRTGNPENTGGGGTWKNWVQIASRDYIDTKIGDVLSLPVLTAEPASPADGMVAIADGTSWNPTASGVQTMVVRLGGAWKQIAIA